MNALLEKMVEEFGEQHRYRIADALGWWFMGPWHPRQYDESAVRDFVHQIVRD